MRIGTKSPIMPSHIHTQGPRSDALIQPSVLPWLYHANSNYVSSLEKSYPKGRTQSSRWAALDNDSLSLYTPVSFPVIIVVYAETKATADLVKNCPRFKPKKKPDDLEADQKWS